MEAVLEEVTRQGESSSVVTLNVYLIFAVGNLPVNRLYLQGSFHSCSFLLWVFISSTYQTFNSGAFGSTSIEVKQITFSSNHGKLLLISLIYSGSPS